MLRRRKVTESEKKPESSDENKTDKIDSEQDKEEKGKEKKKGREETEDKRNKHQHQRWSCVDSCCWFIGCICSIWWFLLFLYNAMPASFPQYVTEAITGPLPDPPGVKLQKEGLSAKHPVLFVPGIVTGGLELWEGHQCADGLFRKRLWGGTFGEVYKRPLCWVEHMSLDNETGLDPSGIRVRPVTGLVAADYFAPGYFVWAVLIANLARIGYEEKTMYMAAYDWRISFQNTEVRDQSLSRIKSNIELMVATNDGKKVVVIPHSMGVLYFLHFMKWVEAPAPMGGGGGPDWCAKHIKAVMNIGGPFLGVPKAAAGLFSAEAKDVAVARAIAPGVLDSDYLGLQTLQHVMRMTRTWDSTMSMIPKGGDTIWGGLDWSPEEGYDCSPKKQKNNDTHISADNGTVSVSSQSIHMNYGRIISFGKDVAEAHSSQIEQIEFRGAVKGNKLAKSNVSCDIWTEYHEMGLGGIKAVADYKVYTAGSFLDLLNFVAPKMMQRGSAHFSYGIAEDLDFIAYISIRRVIFSPLLLLCFSISSFLTHQAEKTEIFRLEIAQIRLRIGTHFERGMDLWSVHLQSSHRALFSAKISPFLQRNSWAERQLSSNFGKVGFLGMEDGGGFLEIRVSKLKCSSYRCLAVRAMGKKNHENSSNSGSSDQPIPEGDDANGSNTSDNTKSDDTATRKSHHVISDWRTFRANLVAQEQVKLSDGNATAHDSVSRESAKQLGLKWAHPIPVPEAGCVLVATEKLDGVGTFERTVVLLLRSGTKDPREGPFGVILNRPLRKKIKHMKPSNHDLATTFSECSLHFGGPLEASMFLLKTSENFRLPNFEQVIPGLCYGAKNSLDEAAGLVKKGILKPKDFRFFVGYAGWQFDQLREEIESEYWYVAACSANLINGGPQDSGSDLWEEILQLMGGHYSEVSRKPKQDSS